ncbi:MAG: PHA/PHB synthase family protein [Alphaproteobacteria bacterium]
MNPLRPEEVFHFWPRMVQKAADQASLAFSSFVETSSQAASSPFSPFSMGKLFSEAMEHLAQNPATALKAQENLASEFYDLWIHTLAQMQTGQVASVIEPEKTDKRFNHPKWNEDPFFNFIKQSYLLTSKWLLFIADNVPELDEKQRHKVSFYTKQILDAVSPSNFPLTNPKVIEKIIETKGENLVKGFENFMEDLKRGNGQLAISMTQPDAFELGFDLATTPGQVVFQNPLFQLIQYHPTTEKVLKTPLLIIPPWINKYYIFDLRPKNSFVKWAVDQGHTVFMISWVNPDKSLAQKTFEDYMLEGLGQALSVVRAITSEPKVNLVGYCLGGNLLSCFLSYLASKNRDEVLTATYLATLIDFSRAGDLSVFIDEEQLRTLESKMAEKGYLEGRSMAVTFNLLRANDLIWSFFINNYLLGQEPFPLDFLYWNADSTRMPAAMHSYYLRNMFQKNLLRKAGGLNLGGVSIDLRQIKAPSFIIATREDHIAPWRCCYAGSQLYGGDKEFVLATSGHVAGVINPADSGKYSYLTNPSVEKDPLDWLKKAKENQGSWWPYWQKWVQRYAKETVPARKINHPKFPSLEDAPGSYVRVKG